MLKYHIPVPGAEIHQTEGNLGMQGPFSTRAAALAVAGVLVSSTALSACSTTSEGSSDGSTPGVSDDTITLGALSTLTGTFAAGSKRQLAGARLYWDQVNASGGVCDGRSVEIEARDNGYDPQQTVTAYSDISSDILAIQLLTGTPMTEAVAPQMESDHVSAIPMSWSPDLLGRGSVLIPGTTYNVDMANAIDYLLETKQIEKGDTVGYIYFEGDFGGAGLEGAEYAADQHDITIDPYQVDPTVTDLSAQIKQIADNDSSAILMSTSPPLLANAAALADTRGLDVPIIVPTPTFVPELLDSPAAAQIAERVLVFSPYNAWTADTAGVKSLRKEFEKNGDSGTPQQFYIAGYAAAKLMHSALTSVCEAGSLTREALEDEFAQADTFAMDGLSVDLDFSNRDAPAALGDYVLEVDTDVPGGLVPVERKPFVGADASSLVAEGE